MPSNPSRTAAAPCRLNPMHFGLRGPLAVPLVALLAACTADSPSLTAPATGAARQRAVLGAAPASARLSDRLRDIPGACILGARTADGQYRTRSVAIALGPAAGPLVRVVYRGWSTAAAEPTRAAVCNIPDTPGARAQFSRLLDGRALPLPELRRLAVGAGVPGAQAWTEHSMPARVTLAQGTYVIDGLVAAPAAGTLSRTEASTDGEIVGPPDPRNPIVYCTTDSPELEPGCTSEGEDEPDPNSPPPPDPEATSDQITYTGVDSSSAASTAAGGYCDVSLDKPHLSFTVASRINVHTTVSCTEPIWTEITTKLERFRSFFFGFFWRWDAIAVSRNLDPATTWARYPTYASCAWRDGWYRGRASVWLSYHGIRSTGPDAFSREGWVECP